MQTASRERILQEASHLFIEQGYHRLSMRELAQNAGISKAGIYHHFKDKESLFLAVLVSHLDELETIVETAAQTNYPIREKVAMMVREMLASALSQRAIIRLARQEMEQLSSAGQETLREAYHQKFIGQITALLAEGVQSGEFRDFPRPF